MTSRERIRATFARQTVDRVPVDFDGTRQSGISVWAHARLRARLGVGRGTPPRVYDTYQMLAVVEREIADRCGADCVGLHRPAVAFGIRNEDWRPLALPDGLVVEVPGGFAPEPDGAGGLVLRRAGTPVAVMPRGSHFFDRLEKYPGALHPDLAVWRAPRLDGPTLEHYHRAAAALRAESERAVVAPLGPPYELFNGLGQGGFEDWMVTFASEPEYVDDLYAELVAAWLENLAAFHGAVGDDGVDVIQICDDFGTQHAPFLSPAMFRARLLPAYRRGLDWIHRHTPWKVLLHSDGALVPLLPLLVEMGVDALNPVQTSAAGMDPARLARDFGDRLVFWGGSVDGQSTLPHGTPAEVAAEAATHLHALGAGGGHVFAPIHNIQANVPPDNVLALFEAARGFRPAVSASP